MQSFLAILSLILVVGKLWSVTDISWFLVFLPVLLIPLLVFATFAIGVALAYFKQGK